MVKDVEKAKLRFRS